MPRIYLSPPEVGPYEREMLLDALDSNWLAPVGPDIDAFEDEICAVVDSKCGVAVSSGSSACTSTKMSMIGLACMPGMAVLPT